MHSYDKVAASGKEGEPVRTVKTEDNFFMKENSNYLNKLAEGQTSLKPILKPLSARNSRSNSHSSQTLDRSQPKTLRFKFSASALDLRREEEHKPAPLDLGTEILHKNDRASDYVTELEGSVIKLRTDNEIMAITMRHVQDELNIKSDLIRRQQQEMSELRTMLLEL